jgi:hypothetical protein
LTNSKIKVKMTENQQRFLEALFGEAKGNYREAMRIAGYSDNTPTKDVVEPLSEEIEKMTRSYIAWNGPKAVMILSGILDGSELLGVKEKIAVAKDFLDRAGFGKVEKIEVEAKSPLFILPAKRYDDETE